MVNFDGTNQWTDRSRRREKEREMGLTISIRIRKYDWIRADRHNGRGDCDRVQ
jgi:hypothetical protein